MTGLIGGLAVYFILWWLAFLAVLPFGVRTIEETGDMAPGHAPSAPARPHLLRKMVAATLIGAVLWGALYLLIVESGLTLDDIPLPRPPGG